jgi:hypothetical protein
VRLGRCLAIVTLLVPAAAFAVDFPDASYKAMPCRPTIACTADFVPTGVVELDTGYLYRRLGNGADQHSVPFLLKLTLAEWVQLQVGSNGPTFASMPAPARFFDDITVGLKLHLHDQDERSPSLSVSGTASLPMPAATGYLRRGYDAFFIFYVTKDVCWLHIDFNAGVNLWQLDATPRAQPWAALAMSTALPRGFGPMIELRLRRSGDSVRTSGPARRVRRWSALRNAPGVRPRPAHVPRRGPGASADYGDPAPLGMGVELVRFR